MRICCVAPYVPHRGVDHAGGLYLYHYLSSMTRLGASITLVSPRTEANLAAIRSLGLDVNVVLHSPTRTRYRAIRAVRLVATGLSSAARLTSALVETASNSDILDLQWPESLAYAPDFRRAFPSLPIVGNLHDVRTQRVARARKSGSVMKRMEACATTPAVRRSEKIAANACDRLYVFKDEDRSILKKLGSSTPSVVTKPYVDLPDDPPQPLPGSRRILFVAAFWRSENAEAAHWFLEEIFPRVLAQMPDVTVRFAGAAPSDFLRDANPERVEVTGYLPDLSDAYREVELVVAPLRRGAGVKFKVAQAMAWGFPVVTTSIGAEGIEEHCGYPPTCVADDSRSFADSVVRLLCEPKSASRVALDRRAVVARRLDFHNEMQRQFDDYRNLISQKRP